MKLVPGYEYQLHLALDFRVALEAVLIQRLRQQPETRHQEWLRRLLVLGFREECKSLRQTADQTIRPASGTAFAQWLTQEPEVNDVIADKPTQTVVTLGPAQHKPLAALQKVLGEQVT
jgi:hypothetical protein